MKRLILTKPIIIQGLDYWGRNSFIEFHPYGKNGWYWDTGNGIVPISYEIVERKTRRMTLCANGRQLNVYEHIGVLKFLGIDNILIKSSKWPPYDGSAWIYYEAIRPNLKEEGLVSWVKIVGYTNESRERNSLETCNELIESKSTKSYGLLVEVKAGWKPLKTLRKSLVIFDGENPLLEVLKIKAQGYPFYLSYFNFIASILGLPVKNNITWLQNNGPEETATLFLQHRILDLLGTMSLFDCKSLPSGKIVSEFGDHEIDLLILKKYFA